MYKSKDVFLPVASINEIGGRFGKSPLDGILRQHEISPFSGRRVRDGVERLPDLSDACAFGNGKIAPL